MHSFIQFHKSKHSNFWIGSPRHFHLLEGTGKSKDLLLFSSFHHQSLKFIFVISVNIMPTNQSDHVIPSIRLRTSIGLSPDAVVPSSKGWSYLIDCLYALQRDVSNFQSVSSSSSSLSSSLYIHHIHTHTGVVYLLQ